MPFRDGRTYPCPGVSSGLIQVGKMMVPPRRPSIEARLTGRVVAEGGAVVSDLRARHVGESAQHDEPQRRETSADHANVDLDG
jgi:hypothetical protein